MLSTIYQKIKNTVQDNQGKSLACLGIGTYFLMKYLTHEIPEVMISRFLLLLKNNSIEEVVVRDKDLFFKGIGGKQWFLVNIAMLSKEMLFNLVLKKGTLKVTSQDSGKSEKYLSIGFGKHVLVKSVLIYLVLFSGFIMWKMMKTMD